MNVGTLRRIIPAVATDAVRTDGLVMAAAAALLASGCGRDGLGTPYDERGLVAVSSQPQEIVSGQRRPVALTADGNNLYWVDLGDAPPVPEASVGDAAPLPDASLVGEPHPDGPSGLPMFFTNGAVMKCSIQGCNDEPTTLAAGRQSTQPGVWGDVIAVDAANVYWSDDTPQSDTAGFAANLFRCTIDGCSGEPTAVLPNGPSVFAVSGGGVYWTEGQDGAVTIEGCWLPGCTSPRTLASASMASSGVIAADATSLYWTDVLGNLFRCAIAACSTTVETLLTNFRQGPPITDPSGTAFQGDIAEFVQIVVDDTNLYLVNGYTFGDGGIIQCAKADACAHPIQLASNRNGPVALAVDSQNVYWTESGNNMVGGEYVPGTGQVLRCAIGGCNGSPSILADNQNGPNGIVVTSTAVYWATYGLAADDGAINVVAK